MCNSEATDQLHQVICCSYSWEPLGQSLKRLAQPHKTLPFLISTGASWLHAKHDQQPPALAPQRHPQPNQHAKGNVLSAKQHLPIHVFRQHQRSIFSSRTPPAWPSIISSTSAAGHQAQPTQAELVVYPPSHLSTYTLAHSTTACLQVIWSYVSRSISVLTDCLPLPTAVPK